MDTRTPEFDQALISVGIAPGAEILGLHRYTYPTLLGPHVIGDDVRVQTQWDIAVVDDGSPEHGCFVLSRRAAEGLGGEVAQWIPLTGVDAEVGEEIITGRLRPHLFFCESVV